MAIQIPETLYTGGNVRFDSSPSTNLFLRLQQQRQAQETAKKEALNQYFTDAIKQVNPAGIREVHLRGPQGGILDDIEKWKQWSIQNKNEIAKGGAARMESDMMVSEIARKIQQAKKRDQTFLEIGKSQFEGKFDPDEDDLKIVDKMSRSIYDPESYKQDRVSEYGYSDLSPNLPQYDPLKGFESFTKGMKTGKTFDEGKGRRDPQTGLEWIPYTEKFAEPQIKQIALNAAGEYESNRVAKRYWDNQFKSITEPELAELNKTFKRYFGSVPIKGADGKIIDVSNINTAQDYAAAVTALKAEGFIGEQGEVPKSDYQRRQQDQINKIYISDALIRGRQGGSSNTPTWDLTEYSTESDGGKNLTVPFQGYTFTDILGSKFGAKKVVYYPDKKQFKITEYTSRDNEGNPTGEKTRMVSAQTLRQDIQGSNPQADMKAFDALVGTPGAAKTEPAKPSGTYTIKGKKYTLAQLQKMGYNEQQVSQYKDK